MDSTDMNSTVVDSKTVRRLNEHLGVVSEHQNYLFSHIPASD